MKKKLLLGTMLLFLNFITFLQATNSTPVVTRAYGDRFVGQQRLDQEIGGFGALDTTFGAGGSLDCSSQVGESPAKAIRFLSDGSFFAAFDDGSDAKVVKYSATGVVQTSWLSGGSITLNGLRYIRSMEIDSNGRILLAGGNDSDGNSLNGWIARINNDGSTTTFSGTLWDFVGSVAEQSSGRIIAAGRDNTNGVIVGYTVDGQLDETFGSAGVVTLSTTSGIYTMVIDSANSIYVAYYDSGVTKVQKFNSNGTPESVNFGTITIPYLAGASFNQIRMVIDNSGQLVIGAQVGNDLKFSGLSAFDGSAHSTFANLLMDDSDVLFLTDLLAVTDGGFLVVGFTSDRYMCVDSITSGGISDVTFNASGTPGYHEFNIGSPSDYSVLTSGAISPDGRFYVVGSQSDTTDYDIDIEINLEGHYLGSPISGTKYESASAIGSYSSVVTLNPGSYTATVNYTVNSAIDGDVSIDSVVDAYNGDLTYSLQSVDSYDNGSTSTVTPYISCLYGRLVATTNAFMAEVAQFPVALEQGDLDGTFGATESIDGVVRPFSGVYGASLQQKADAIIELASGKLLVGLSGFTDSSATSHMILNRLNADGTVDTAFGINGYAELSLNGLEGLHITSLAENLADNSILVSGYSDVGGVVRLHSGTTGAQIGARSILGIEKVLGVATQGSQRVIGFSQLDSSHGIIDAFVPDLSGLDTTFNVGGSIPGRITTSDFGLTNMGPLYGYAIDPQDNIIIAYKNATTNRVDVAKIYADGSGLVEDFGNNGIQQDIFGDEIINEYDVRCAVDNEGQIIIAAVLSSSTDSYSVKQLFSFDGSYDTTFGTVTQSVGTVAVLNDLAILNDNTILLTGYDNAADDSMVVVRMTTIYGAGQVDETFNPQGTTPGVVTLQVGNVVDNYHSRVATGLAVQSSTGDIVISAYEQQTASLSVPMVIRVIGKSGTTLITQHTQTGTIHSAGVLDTDFDIENDGTGDGSKDLTSLTGAGAAKQVYAYRMGSPYQGYLLVGVDNGTDTIITRVRESDTTLDLTFGSGTGSITLSGLYGVNHLSIDVDSNILVGGSSGGTVGWARRLTPDGVADVLFDVPNFVTAIHDIAQQKSGRYIVAGSIDDSLGGVIAFRNIDAFSEGLLSIDPTFSPYGEFSGVFTHQETARIVSLSINSDDTILVAYIDSGNVKVDKIMANGASLVSSFATSGTMSTGSTATDPLSVHIAIDANNLIVVAHAGSNGTDGIYVGRFYANGSGIDSAFNGQALQAINDLGSAGVTVANLIIDENNKILVFGTNTVPGYGANGRLYGIRLDSDGVLDTTWNVDPVGTDVVGIHTFDVASATNMYGSSIFINGSIYLAASSGSTTPLLLRMFGDNYVGQVEQQPFEVDAGIIDTTLDILTPGANSLDVSAQFFASGLSGYASKKLYIYDNGDMLIAMSNGTDTKVVKMSADYTVDTNFGTAGIATIASAGNVRDLYVANGDDNDGSIFLTGEDSGALWAVKLDSSGVDQSFSAPNTLSMSLASRIRETKNSRILIAGYHPSSGIVAAYKPDGSGLDLSFNNGLGYYETGINSGIYDIAIDEYDRLYIAYNDGTSIVVQRLLANGTGVDAAFAPTPIVQTNALSASQISLELHELHGHMVVAVQDGTTAGNMIKVVRFHTHDGSMQGSVNITVPGVVLNLSDLIDSLNNIYVMGYTGDNNLFVANIYPNPSDADQFILDPSWGTAGIANVSGGSMTSLVSGALHPDRRLYVVGSSSTPVPYMARFFNNFYNTEEFAVVAKAIPGEPDYTLDSDAITPNGALVLPGLTNYTAYAVYANADGSCYVAFGDGTSVVVGKVNADGNFVTTGFGTSGLTDTIAMTQVKNMIVDQSGKVIVCGIDAGGSEKIIRYSSTGSLDNLFTRTFADDWTPTALGEQKSGRILVSGYDADAQSGIIVAYKNTGEGQDTTFGPYGFSGYYLTGVDATIDDFCIDSNDDMYIVYRQGGTVRIAKVKESGLELDAVFGSGSAIDTGIEAISGARVAINDQGNILVAGTISLYNSLSTIIYNGLTGAIEASDANSMSDESPVYLSDMTAAGDKFLVSAYGLASYSQESVVYVVRIGTDAGLDYSFADSGIIDLNSPESAVSVRGIAVQPDGKIVLVGDNDTVDPVFIRVYGDPYVSEYAQYPGRELAGILDATLDPVAESVSLSSLIGVDFTTYAGGYRAVRMHTYENDDILFLCTKEDGYILARVHKDFSLDTAGFNSGGVTGNGSSAGYIKETGLSGLTNITSLHVDRNGSIFVAGGAGTTFVKAYNSSGLALPGWTNPTSNMSAGAFALEQQGLSRLIVAGQDTNGMLYGYTIEGDLDPAFGNGVDGKFDTGVATAIADISIDSSDRIAIVYASGGSSVLKCVEQNGLGFDDSLPGTGTAISSVLSNQVLVTHDSAQAGHVIVAAATAAGFTLARYNVVDGSDNGSQVVVPVGASDSTSHISQLYVTSDDKVVMVGYKETGNVLVVIRLNADFTLDNYFGTNGVFSQAVGSMENAYDGMIYNDNRIYLLGDDTVEPFVSRIFGDDYVTELSQSLDVGVAGTVDTTYHAFDSTPGSYDFGSYSLEQISHAQVGQGLVLDSSGRVVVVGTTADNHLYLARYTAEGNLDTTFNSGSVNGAPGYVIDPIGVAGFGITLDESGNILVVGEGEYEGPAVYVARYTSAGILDETFDPRPYGNQGYYLSGIGDRGLSVAVDSLGRIVVCGYAWGDQFYIIRFTSTGDIDTAFNAGITPGYIKNPIGSRLNSLVIDENDNIVAVGTTVTSDILTVRYTSAGVLDTTFNTVGYIIDTYGSQAYAVHIDTNNKIVVAGTANNASDGYVARYTQYGQLDNDSADGNDTFNTVGYQIIDNCFILGMDLFQVAEGEEYILLSGGTSFTNQGVMIILPEHGGLSGQLYPIDDSQYCWDIVIDDNFMIYVTGTNVDATKLYLAHMGEGADIFAGGSDSQGISFVDHQPKAVIANEDGGHYVAFDNGQDASVLIRMLADDALDTSYNGTGIAENAPQGIRSMIVDGLGRIILVGRDIFGTGNGWIQRYTTNGTVDFVLIDEGMDESNVVVEQTLARLVVGGINSNENTVLRAYTNLGEVDTTFNSAGPNPGEYSFDDNYNGIYGLVADEYDRLIVAFLNGNSGNVDIARLTSDGELDTTFGTNNSGVIVSALTDVHYDTASVRLVVDQAGNIVVVAVHSGLASFVTAQFDNGIAVSGNGVQIGSQVQPVSGLQIPVITSLVAVDNGDILVGGYMTADGYLSDNNTMWVASMTSAGVLNSSTFNPDAIGGTAGLMTYVISDESQDIRALNAMTIKNDGRISAVGYEEVSGVETPYILRAYNHPYTTQEEQFLGIEPIGTHDQTFGVTVDSDDRISFFASAGVSSSQNQIAQAVALQGLNRIVVAVDGQSSADTTSRVFLNRFNIDGILDTTFNGTGQVQVPHLYENEHVRDMAIFTTPEGVSKAIIAGYAENTALGLNTSWLMQYNLDTFDVDTTFGGIDKDSQGVVSGDIQQFNAVALQGSGRTIVSGLNYDDIGTIVGYNSVGKLDKSFGSDGFYFSQAATGIYSHVVDSQDRVVFAYNNGGTVVVARLLADGSGLDSSFNGGTATDEITLVVSGSDIRIGIDINDDIYVVAVRNNGTEYAIAHYGVNGGLAGSATVTSAHLGGITSLTIAKIAIDLDGKLIIVGTDNLDNYLVVRLTDDFDMDTTFNETGYLKYKINSLQSIRQATDAVIHPDGRLIVSGLEVGGIA